jgi:hypothetical protein
MVLLNGMLQSGTHYMRVDLRRPDIRMPEHNLYAAQVRSSFEQVRRESMAQNVWTQIPKNTS